MSNRFESNLRILRQRRPQIASLLEEPLLDLPLRAEPGEAGWPLLTLLTADHERIPLYHPRAPVEAIEAELGERTFRAEDATVLFGFGLGYHAEAIARRMEMDHQLFVIEPVPSVFGCAMRERDLRSILEHDRIHIFVGTGLSGLYEIMEYHLLRIVAGSLNELTVTGLARAFPEPYAEAVDQVAKIRSHLEFSYRFNVDNHLLLQNLIENAGFLKECGDMAALAGVLEGRPALVVSGGPSLSRNIHHLAGAAGKACLICVDTALKPLVERGIRPDLVVSADPFPQNARKIEGLCNGEEIPLLFDIGVHRAIPSFFRGPKFVTSSRNALAKWLVRLSGFQENFGRCTSAAHLAFHAARLMKADPIVFAGLDLAFPGGNHHVEGASFTWAPADDSAFVMVPDVFGGMVKTVPGFQAMIGLFEREIAETPVQCIDATEGGARIEGTDIMPLSDVADTFGPSLDPPVRSRLEKIHHTPSREAGAALMEGVQRLSTELRTAKSTARKAIPLIGKAKKLLGLSEISSSSFQKAATRIVELDRKLGRLTLLDEALIDFRAELVAFQFLQSYRIQRENRQAQNLALTLESMERSFQDALVLAEQLLPLIRGLSFAGPVDLSQDGSSVE